MRWNISAWAIRNPAPPLLFCALLCLVGAFSFGQLPIMRYPNIDKPIVTVAISDTGVAPTELETQIILAGRLHYLPASDMKTFTDLSGSVGRLTHGLLRSLDPSTEPIPFHQSLQSPIPNP